MHIRLKIAGTKEKYLIPLKKLKKIIKSFQSKN